MYTNGGKAREGRRRETEDVRVGGGDRTQGVEGGEAIAGPGYAIQAHTIVDRPNAF